MARVIRFIIAGAVGGLVGWMIVEPMPSLTPSGVETLPYPALITIGMIIGLCLGLALGIAEALSGMGQGDRVRVIGLSALIGAGGGMVGLAFGQAFYGTLIKVSGDVALVLLGFICELVGRSVGWALFGMFIGATQGIVFAAPKRMMNGGVGGFIGGGIGGGAFALLRMMNQGGAVAFPAEMLRLIGFCATGTGIGLFIGLFEELFKQAWVRVLRGRNEGREFILYKDSVILGRDELADVPVFGDTSVAPRHAEIRLENNRYVIYDLGAPFGTAVNGDKVAKQALRDGDVIELGSVQVEFHEKATASPVSRYIDREPSRKPQIPTSERVCPFCGGIKDASGNCRCTVSAASGSGPAPGAAAPPAAAPHPFSSSVPHPPGDLSASAPIQQPTASQTAAGEAALVGVSGPYAGQRFTLSAAGASI